MYVADVGLLPCMFSLLSEGVQGVSLTPMIAYIDFLEYYVYHIIITLCIALQPFCVLSLRHLLGFAPL